MNTFTHSVKVKDVLFFATLALVSLLLHAILLFGFRLTFRPLEERPKERQFIKVGFVKRARSAPDRVVRMMQSPLPNPKVTKRPTIKRNQPLPPDQALEEEAREMPEIPEQFSRFLDQIDNSQPFSEFEFQGDTYDILEGGFLIAGSEPGTERGVPGLPRKLLDPRVQMVVSRVPRDVGKSPPTYFEPRYSHVPYPDIEVEKKHYQKGWLSVYFIVDIDANGEVEQIRRVRPQNPDELQMLFVNAVLDSINGWTFDREKSFLHVDVRFYVE